ncbi:hypothetical protein BDA96_05G044300 [Sorghum bicolor]|uniref:Uncharacterized protein n=1 Tax=Sorghum bicolor TaxID=4558 RepID=A0A921UEK6_SORBI|nr:hypothetical protein BDA96_05G044300 [Sorghum bicolor]
MQICAAQAVSKISLALAGLARYLSPVSRRRSNRSSRTSPPWPDSPSSSSSTIEPGSEVVVWSCGCSVGE